MLKEIGPNAIKQYANEPHNALFETESKNINEQVSHFILHKLSEY